MSVSASPSQIQFDSCASSPRRGPTVAAIWEVTDSIRTAACASPDQERSPRLPAPPLPSHSASSLMSVIRSPDEEE